MHAVSATFLALPARAEPLIEDSDHRVESGGDNRAHVEHGPDLCAPAPHRPSAPECPAVAVEWGHADEGGDLLVRQGAQFRKTRQAASRSSTGPTPGTLAAARLFHARRDSGEWPPPSPCSVCSQLPFEPGDMRPQTFADRRRARSAADSSRPSASRPVVGVGSTARPRRGPPHPEAAAATAA